METICSCEVWVPSYHTTRHHIAAHSILHDISSPANAQTSKFTFLGSLLLYPRCLLPWMMSSVAFLSSRKIREHFLRQVSCVFSGRKRIPFANMPHITCILWPTVAGASFIWGTSCLFCEEESNNFCSNSVSMLKYPALN